MAEPTAPVIPPTSAIPETMEMTTIIENGKTIVLPMQRISTGLARQSGFADGWAGLGFTTTTAALAPEVGTTELPVPVPTTALPSAPVVTSAAPVVPVVSAGGVVVVPPGAATSVAPVSIPTTAKVVEGVVPPVLQDNDKPSVVVVPSTSRTTLRPPSTSTVIPPGGLLSLPPKRTTTSRQVLTLNPGLPATTSTSSARTSAATSVPSAIPTTAPTSTSASALALIHDLPSSTSSRYVWNLVDISSDEVVSKTSATAGLVTGGLLNQGPQAGATSTLLGGAVSKTTQNPGITSAALAGDQAEPTAQLTLPSPGSPDESNVRALVSSSITLSGTAAVAAIKSGIAVQLESASGDVKGTTDAKGGLNEFVIAGIVAGGVLVLIIIIVVWYRWRKKSRAKEEEESQPPTTSKRESGFDFSDDPITASTGRMRRGTFLGGGGGGGGGGRGPFDDRYQSQSGQTQHSHYNPDLPVDQAEDDGYPFFRNVHNQLINPSAAAAQDGYFSPTSRQDPLDALYGHAIQAEQARREVENPFAPPVPPLPASVRLSGVSGISAGARPTTGMTDIYGAYGSSRPGTQVDDRQERLAYERDDSDEEDGSEEDDDRDRPAKTPSTSSLLPWLKNASPPPPVPSLPKASGPSRAEVSNRRREDRRKVDVPESVQDEYEEEEEEEVDDRAYTRYEPNAAGMGAQGGGMRAPARPAMAQTPAGVGGNSFGVAIPGFR